MIAGCIEDVQLMNFAANAVEFAMKILNRRRIRVLEFATKKTRNERCFADASGSWKLLDLFLILSQFEVIKYEV